ncbi:hypothetical protein ACCC88_03100 [Sphingomonas sp. Sphisp140]|uniref:hypothetical protein n=1 Tax=unclassified Sphingomonas TaxID=196159 RepID=UPI0039AF10A6
MAKENDIEYLSRRVEEERDRAEHARDPSSYRAHTEFARAYERKLQALIASQVEPQFRNGHAVI